MAASYPRAAGAPAPVARTTRPATPDREAFTVGSTIAR